ncbi:MAG: CPBP family intramembrane metalloprotease [Pirellulaceae bacterium]|nr:CPBP family intramembrane metalloprotease [Pirellulaceae bacterium]
MTTSDDFDPDSTAPPSARMPHPSATSFDRVAPIETMLVSGGSARPRWWTALAVSGVAFAMCLVFSSLMVFVAMLIVHGELDPRRLTDETFLRTILESRIGFCLMVVPPQLMLLVPAVIAAWMSPIEIRRRLSLVRGHWPIWAWIATAAAAPLVGLVSSAVLGIFMTESDSLKMMTSVFRGHSESGFLIPLALMIGITPAICEEILFRGYVQTRLARSFGPTAGVLVASILFAGFHLDFVHSVAVFPLGLFLGFVVWRSGSLFPAMIAHFVNNVISVIGAATAPADKTDVLELPTIVVSLSILGAGIIGAAVVVLASIYYRQPSVHREPGVTPLALDTGVSAPIDDTPQPHDSAS